MKLLKIFKIESFIYCFEVFLPGNKLHELLQQQIRQSSCFAVQEKVHKLHLQTCQMGWLKFITLTGRSFLFNSKYFLIKLCLSIPQNGHTALPCFTFNFYWIMKETPNTNSDMLPSLKSSEADLKVTYPVVTEMSKKKERQSRSGQGSKKQMVMQTSYIHDWMSVFVKTDLN